MMTRIRPVLASQLAWPGLSLHQGGVLLQGYYNNFSGNFVTTPHAPSYYFYGGGGAVYYNVKGSVSSVIAAGPGKAITHLTTNTAYLTALGLRPVAYEGGPDLPTAAEQTTAFHDPALTQLVLDRHKLWDTMGGDLFTYFQSVDNGRWGFTQHVDELSTPKLAAIDQLSRTAPAAITSGTAVPGTVKGTAAAVCSRVWGCDRGALGAGTGVSWLSYTFREQQRAPWKVTVEVKGAKDAAVAVYVDSRLVGLQAVPDGAGSIMTTTGTALTPGLHSVIVRTTKGTATVKTVSVG